jgi:hypothetical protein
MGSDQLAVPLQTTTLAQWADGSIKWLLLDFQASIKEKQVQELLLQTADQKATLLESTLSVRNGNNEILVDTGSACFHIPTKSFKPFTQVVVDGHNFLSDHTWVYGLWAKIVQYPVTSCWHIRWLQTYAVGKSRNAVGTREQVFSLT